MLALQILLGVPMVVLPALDARSYMDGLARVRPLLAKYM